MEANAAIARLTLKVGKKPEGLKLAEELVFGEHATLAPFDLARMVAEESFREGRSAELLERVEAFRAKREREWREHSRDIDLPLGGHTEATRLIVDELYILKIAQGRDHAALWKFIRNSNVSSLEALNADDACATAVELAADHLIADPQAARPLLHGWYKQGGRGQGWALVLLARVGEVRNVEAVHRLAAAIENTRPGWADDVAETKRQDYLLAAVIADPPSLDTLAARYASTDLTYAAQNVANGVKRSQARAK